MGIRYDLTGQRFGRLVVTKLAFTKERGRKVWACLCDCGGFKHATTETLRAGTAKSCGCLHKERVASLNRSHGASRTKTYRIWCGLRARCAIPSATGYAYYGGRGIKVSAQWSTYEGFLADMGACPEGTSLERRNLDGNYELGNCYWATNSQQARNTSRTRYVEVDGVKRVAMDVAAENKIANGTFKTRLYKLKWPIERACGLVSADHREPK